MKRPTIALTMGDPGGVGPEVTLKSLTTSRNPKCHYVIFGDSRVISHAQKKLRIKVKLHEIPEISPKFLKPGKVHLVDASAGRKSVWKPKVVSKANAQLAMDALACATENALQKKVNAIVTAPIHKTGMRLIDKKFKGHTEYLANAAKVKKYAMFFYSDKLKVTLATIHVAHKSVYKLINKKLIQDKIQLTHDFLKKYMKIRSPKIAVCALNPHGRETGTEEDAVIQPAVRSMKKKRMNVVGPLSADQLFYEAYHGVYDAVISMYHDQGLGPFKMIAFDQGVNTTLGLPFVRTSPDHGTAHDIAYQNKANPSSMRSSLRLAEKLAHAVTN